MSAPRPDEFTEETRGALAQAAEHVKRLGGYYIEPQHVLLSLLEARWSAAARLLGAQGVDTARLAADLEARLGPPGRKTQAQPVPGPALDQVLRLALSEARRHGEGYVGSEHVLVALLTLRDGMACALLEQAGARLDVARGYARTRTIAVADLGSARRAPDATPAELGIRIGIGYDVHDTLPGGRLVLGGVTIPCEIGLRGHSDADVLTHAIMDALLGAAALGDIGRLFPDSDPQYAGASSVGLLEEVVAHLEREGWRPHNVDAVVIAERPRIAPHADEMRRRLAAALGVERSRVSVKGTTTEGLGFEGDGLGIAAQAVVLIAPV